jgi:hypothetical protein
MKYLVIAVVGVVAVMLAAGAAQADPTWYKISFSGTDMFSYTATTSALADQNAPRRLRTWIVNGPEVPDTLLSTTWSDTDSNSNGTNDFAEWAAGNLASYKFSYFNLIGGTIPANYWDQPYHAVPSTGVSPFGVDSWRNQTLPTGWTGGIVQANQGYQSGTYDNYAFPVWRAPEGGELTLANAASLQFSVEVLMENYSTAFEPDGKLRVWFGGYDTPQDTLGATSEVGGVMLTPEPATLAFLGLGGIVTLLRRRK